MSLTEIQNLGIDKPTSTARSAAAATCRELVELIDADHAVCSTPTSPRLALFAVSRSISPREAVGVETDDSSQLNTSQSRLRAVLGFIDHSGTSAELAHVAAASAPLLAWSNQQRDTVLLRLYI